MKTMLHMFTILSLLGLSLAPLGGEAQAGAPAAPLAGEANFVAVQFDYYNDNTQSVAWGDYDGDGDLDLAAGNYNQPSRVYENEAGLLKLDPANGLGWQAPVSDRTSSVAWGDWDGDGDLDLALGNNGYSQVYENASGALQLDPAHGLGWQAPVSKDTRSVAWGDWDGDGDLDLAMGNHAQPNQVYENTGGTLQLDPANGLGWQQPMFETYTSAVAWGDYDGDGDLDLAIGNYLYEPCFVYENEAGTLQLDLPNGLGWRAPQADATTAVAWGDWDGDGDLDLAVGNLDGPYYDTSKVYENDGGALQFNPAGGLGWEAATVERTYSVAWGDYDGDGDLDLAVGNSEAPNKVYENDAGTLAFDPAGGLGWQAAIGYYTGDVAWGDYDGDGDLDLAVGNNMAFNQLYQNASGTLQFDLAGGLGWQTPAFNITRGVAWGDYDGDGDLDLALGNEGGDGRHSQVYENAAGTLLLDPANGLGWQSSADDYTTSLAWGDYDGDGDLDLALGNWLQPSKVYENEGGALQFAPANGLGWQAPGGGEDTSSVAWGDYDGDGDLDLAMGNSNSCKVYENVAGALQLDPANGLGWWTVTKYTRSVAWGDYDGDGDLDLAVGNGCAGGTNCQFSTVYENAAGALQLDPAHGLGWQAPASNDTQSVAWGDYDNDGDLDLALGNYNQPSRVYANVGGDLQFDPANGVGWWSDSADKTYSVAWGDYDGDGDLDLALGNGCDSAWANCQPIKVYTNVGGALQFDLASGQGWQAPVSENTHSVAWGDYDGDGDLDLAVGNLGFNSRVYENAALPAARPALAIHGLSSPAPTASGGQVSALAPANGYAVSWARDNGTIPISYTLLVPDGAPQVVSAEYSLNGGGQWFPALPVSGTLTQIPVPMQGGALRFDGVNDYVEVPTSYYLQPDNFTVEAWIKADSWTAEHWRGTIVGKDLYSGEAQGYALRTGDNGRLSFVMGCDSGWPEALSAPLMQAGVWYHVAGTYNGITMTALINGDPVASAVCANMHRTGANLKIGSSPDAADRLFDGAIDEVRLWRVVRTPAQLRADRYRQTSGSAPGLEAYWRLDEGAGSAAQDQTAQAHHGALFNGPLWTVGAPRQHVFAWDVFGSAFFGRSDNVVLRLRAQPDLHPRPNRAPGLYQYSAASTLSFPLRVRGNQVRVLQGGNPAEGALVYRLPQGQGPGNPYVNLAGQPYQTNAQGYLQGYGAVALGDQLVALRLAQAASLDFDGVNDYVAVPHQASQQPITFTVEARIRAESWKTPYWSGPIVAKMDGDGGLHGYALVAGDEGRLGLYLSCGGMWTGVVSGPRMALDTWYHVAGTFDGTTLTALIDGEAVAAATCAGAVSASTYPLNIGRNPGYPSRVFDGLIDEVRLWHVARTPAEIQAGMAAHLVGDEPGLEAYWPLDEALGKTVYDQTLHDHDGLIDGAAWQVEARAPGYTLYHTSAAPTAAGLDVHTVQQGGVQTLTLSAANPLALFDLEVALEWDARNDPLYLDTLAYNFQRASELLYDWSNGQAALGQVTVYHDRQHWDAVDVRIYATNRLRPNANQGGTTAELITETIGITATAVITYTPGQVRMGVVWNRYGDPGGSLSDDWARTLAHELGHYLLYLDDNYLGLNAAGLVEPVRDCPGAMSDPYRQDLPYDEFHSAAGWLPVCEQTLSNQATGRSDWATVVKFYPELAVYQASGNPGPATLPLAVTQVSFAAPPYASAALADPIFYLTDELGTRYLPGAGARAFLFQTVWGEDRLVDLGRPVLDHVLARGARLGDRLCVFETGAGRLGCETISANDEQVALVSRPEWQPEIIITPVSSRTITVTVTAALSLTLKARLYPAAGTPTGEITLSAGGVGYSGVFSTSEPALAGYVQVWVEETEPRREALTDYALGGSPGPHGAGSGSGSNAPDRGGVGNLAPVISADGQVLLYGRGLVFRVGEFYVLQELSRFPAPLGWATPIGAAYRLTATAGAPALEEAAISLAYAAGDVPGGEEAWIRAYYWDGASWTILPTTLDTYQNTAAAPVMGPGVYALMSSYQIRLYQGWNLVSYPVYGTRGVTESLSSIAGSYGPVYYYDATDLLDHWKLYDPSVPGWVNDLEELAFGRGYWISATQAITLYLKGAGMLLAAPETPEGAAVPPSTFYGQASGAAGQAVTAWVGSVLCGQGTTREAGGQVVYVVDVLAAYQSPGCGASGRVVSFRVGAAWQPQAGLWSDARPVWLNLWELFQRFLPLVVRR